jgi:hypothetical protein
MCEVQHWHSISLHSTASLVFVFTQPITSNFLWPELPDLGSSWDDRGNFTELHPEATLFHLNHTLIRFSLSKNSDESWRNECGHLSYQLNPPQLTTYLWISMFKTLTSEYR